MCGSEFHSYNPASGGGHLPTSRTRDALTHRADSRNPALPTTSAGAVQPCASGCGRACVVLYGARLAEAFAPSHASSDSLRYVTRPTVQLARIFGKQATMGGTEQSRVRHRPRGPKLLLSMAPKNRPQHRRQSRRLYRRTRGRSEHTVAPTEFRQPANQTSRSNCRGPRLSAIVSRALCMLLLSHA
jgi:hypothetical protein